MYNCQHRTGTIDKINRTVALLNSLLNSPSATQATSRAMPIVRRPYDRMAKRTAKTKQMLRSFCLWHKKKRTVARAKGISGESMFDIKYVCRLKRQIRVARKAYLIGRCPRSIA